MNELKALKERLNRVYFICEMSEQDTKTLESLARFEANIKGFEYNPDFLNEKTWIASDLIDRIENLFCEV